MLHSAFNLVVKLTLFQRFYVITEYGLFPNDFYVGKLGKAKSTKKLKAEPTRQEMHVVVVDILKEVDFNTVSDAHHLALHS